MVDHDGTGFWHGYSCRESIAAFMGIMIFGGMLWKGANRHRAMASVIIAFVTYYIINCMEKDSLMLICKWQPAPFGWAMLAGFLALIIVSKITAPEPVESVNRFFGCLDRISDDDQPDGD